MIDRIFVARIRPVKFLRRATGIVALLSSLLVSPSAHANLADQIYDKDRRVYTETDFNKLYEIYWNMHGQDKSKTCLALAFERNEIPARKGSFFESRMMRLFFDKLEWYQPDFKYAATRLNAYEKSNFASFVAYEKKVGCESYWRLWGK